MADKNHKQRITSSIKTFTVPNSSNTYLDQGIIFKAFGKKNQALFSYLNALLCDLHNFRAFWLATQFLRDSNIYSLDKGNLKDLLNILIESKDISLRDLYPSFDYLFKDKIIYGLEMNGTNLLNNDYILNIINERLIKKGLECFVLRGVHWEIMLTKLRKELCLLNRNKSKDIHKYQPLINALAHQTFLNEYAFYYEQQEADYIQDILHSSSLIEENNISILACYIPLHKVIKQHPSLQFYDSSDKQFNQLLTLQIKEPLEELRLSRSIKKIGSINNPVSQKVKSQYESNPYPRWFSGNLYQGNKNTLSQSINAEIAPNSLSLITSQNTVNVLIAGCGTGLQIIQAQRYENAQIIAIDISSASLSFAQRKINELGINNVEIFQMDILEVSLLEKEFDIIECCGVLHHMDSPRKGLRSLKEILHKNGLMRLSLYSELARKDIIKARKYIKSLNIEPTEEKIRAFRKEVISGDHPNLISLANSGSDFFTTSECRDLIFHYQEHRFTMEEIEEELIANDLKFLGFLLNPKFKALYKNYYPNDETQTNLKNWALFEEKHPYTFSTTPPFWVRRS